MGDEVVKIRWTKTTPPEVDGGYEKEVEGKWVPITAAQIRLLIGRGGIVHFNPKEW